MHPGHTNHWPPSREANGWPTGPVRLCIGVKLQDLHNRDIQFLSKCFNKQLRRGFWFYQKFSNMNLNPLCNRKKNSKIRISGAYYASKMFNFWKTFLNLLFLVQSAWYTFAYIIIFCQNVYLQKKEGFQNLWTWPPRCQWQICRVHNRLGIKLSEANNKFSGSTTVLELNYTESKQICRVHNPLGIKLRGVNNNKIAGSTTLLGLNYAESTATNLQGPQPSWN